MQVLVSKHRFESLIFGNLKDARAAVVYLHGAGEFGSGATGQFEHPGMATLLYRRDMRPQLPVVIACALDGERYDIAALTRYLDELKTRFGIGQLHIIAYSRGGLAAYELAERGYALQTLTIINSHSPTPASHFQCHGPLSRFAFPLHIIQSDGDERVDVDTVKAFAAEYDGELIFTEWNGDHYVIEEILKDQSLWDWIVHHTHSAES